MSMRTETRRLKAHGSTLVGATLAGRFPVPILLICLAIAFALINTFSAPGLGGLPAIESIVGP